MILLMGRVLMAEFRTEGLSWPASSPFASMVRLENCTRTDGTRDPCVALRMREPRAS